MTINLGMTYFLKDGKLTEEDKVNTLINRFRDKFNRFPRKLYINPAMKITDFPGLRDKFPEMEIVETIQIMPNNYHLSLE